jgi:taurine--2-oxoglutarate transaminase
MSRRSFFLPWSKQNDESGVIKIKSVQGSTLKLNSGRHLVDLSSISYQAHFGYNQPKLQKAICNQAQKSYAFQTKADNELKTKASNELLDYLKLKNSGRLFYTLSGSESIENALKMTRHLTGKNIVLARQNSYHGASLGALSVTGDWRNLPHATTDEWTVRIPEPDEDPELKKTRAIIEKVGAQNIAAFCLETVTGGNGVIIPSKKWWSGLQKLSREFNILLILDEVICAFERLGHPLGLHHFKIQPDMICLAKGISAGAVPFGAVWVNEKWASHYDEIPLVQGLTNYAHPLGLAVMRENIKLLKSKKQTKHRQKLTEVFHRELQRLEKLENVQAIRKIGLLAALDLKKTIHYQDFVEAGLQLIVKNGKLVTLAPAYNMSIKQLTESLKTLGHVLGEQ